MSTALWAIAAGLVGCFIGRVVWPQRRMRRNDELLWLGGGILARVADGSVCRIRHRAIFPQDLVGTTRFELRVSSGRADVRVMADHVVFGRLDRPVARMARRAMLDHGCLTFPVDGQLMTVQTGYVVLPKDFTPPARGLPYGHAHGFPVPTPLEPWGPGSDLVVVYGADFFAPDIVRKLYPGGCAPRGDEERRQTFTGQLIPISEGRIGVFVEEQQIGLLCDAQAASHGSTLEDLLALGHSLTVLGDVWLDPEGLVGVRVRIWLPGLDQILPPGLLPGEPHVVLPTGSQLEVRGEEAHVDHLVSLLGGAQDAIAVARLVLDGEEPGAAPRIGVQIDGEEVGELFPEDAVHLEAVVRACLDRGLLALCRATVYGNSLRADVVLKVAHSEALTPEWIETHALGGPGGVAATGLRAVD